MKNRKNWLAVSALLIGSTLLNTAQAGQANNSLVIGTSQEPPNINDPWRTNNLVIATEITWFMEAHLIGKDDNGDLYPEIATRVPSLANGDYKIVKDAKGNVVRNSVTFSIRKDAKWSDGTAITPKDFQFWLKVEQDDRVPVPTREPWDKAKITVQDADTFTITFDPPYLFADQITSAVGLNPAPSAAMEKAWNAFDAATKNLDSKTGAKQITDEWNKFIAQFTTSRGLPKVVSGPFKPTSWRAGNSLVLTRNPNYWITPKGGADKYLQTVQYRFIADTNTLKVNILSGQLDALSYVGLTFDQAIEAQRSERGKYKTYFVPGATWEHVDIANAGARAQSLGLTDKRVRQALLYSIDRDALVKALFQGKQPVVQHLGQPHRQALQERRQGLQLRRGQGQGAVCRRRLEARPRRHPGQRRQEDVAQLLHHRRKQTARARAADLAGAVEGCRSGRQHPELSRPRWCFPATSRRAAPRASGTCSCTPGATTPAWSAAICGPRSSCPARTTPTRARTTPTSKMPITTSSGTTPRPSSI